MSIPPNKTINTIALGSWIRKQFNKTFIFRVRRGNGYYGTILNKRYQDKFTYFAPTSINNTESAPDRRMFATAIEYWQIVLTAQQKEEYNYRANKGLSMSGYNLFLREALTGIYHMYVDRGDPSVVDFDKNDLTTDNTWRDLDLSAIIPSTCRAVLLEVDIEAAHADKEIVFRSDGNTNNINHTGAVTKVNNKDQHKTCIVATGANGIIEYKATDATWTTIDIVARGWWT